ncbi:MAG TPA: hypothetical protein DEF82_10725 [Crocinitomicaceae bacterium]|nr:hypothetical protein [Flavobacteriales bacterium]HBW87181.1 hypothetical protein [Crocinitomicaceae bacterium]
MILRYVTYWFFLIQAISLWSVAHGQKLCGSHKPIYLRSSDELLDVHCMQEDIKEIQENFVYIHPNSFYYTRKEQVDSLFEIAFLKCKKPQKTIDFVEILSHLLQGLHDSHTNISPLVLTQFSDVKKVFPFFLEEINGRYYMQKCYRDIVPRGMECLSVEDIPMAVLHEKAKLFAFQEGMALEANHQMALKLISRIFSAYNLQNKEYFTLQLVDFSGDTIEKRLESAPIRTVLFDKEWNQRESVSYWFDSSGTACLQLGSFSAKSNSGMRRFLDEFFSEVREQKSPHIFIDLRGNSGGYVSVKNYLINYLDTASSDKRERYDFIRSEKDRFSSISWWTKYRYRNYLRHYPSDTLVAKEWEYIKSPYGTHCHLFYDNNTRFSLKTYRGKVSVAINGLSMSASVMFSSWIQSSNRGLLYGEMCMGGHRGTFGDAIQLKLKHTRIPINLSTVKITPLATAHFSSDGVIPDVPIKTNVYQLKEGVDPIKILLGFHKKNITKNK